MTATAGEPRLVDRDRELQAIADVLGALPHAREGRSLELAGEAGIGKSALLRRLSDDARGRGHLVLAGRASEFEAELPFGVVADALDDWAQEAIDTAPPEDVRDLALVLPAFARAHAPSGTGSAEERLRAYRAVRRLLGRAAERSPVVVVLDDVQWADPGSIELLSHLLAHPPRGPVLLAMARRPAQTPERLAAALAAAARDPSGTRLDPAVLSEAGVDELLGEDRPERERRELQRQSGGNPFFLLQLARHDVPTAYVAPTLAAGVVPPAVAATLETELSALSPGARDLLQGAAVVGDPFDETLAAAAAEVPADEATAPLDEIARLGLAQPARGPGTFAFRHPIVRATVYGACDPGWRAAAHGRVAEALAARGAGAAARAPHVERAARPGDLGAVAVLTDAVREAAPRAPEMAARWAAAALAVLPVAPETEDRRIGLLLEQAGALTGAGRLDEARATLVDVLAGLGDDDPRTLQVITACAGVEHLLGRHRDAHARLSRALASLRGDGPERVRLQLELAAGGGYENRAQDMLDAATRALDGARALGDPALEMAAAGQVALARYFLGLPAFEALDEAAAILDGVGDDVLAQRLDVGLWIGWSEAVLERHERAADHCRRVVEVARATGQGSTLLVTITAHSFALVRSGRLAEADRLLRAAVQAGRMAPHLFLSIAVGLAGLVASYRGSPEEGVALGEEGLRLASSADAGLIPGMASFYLAVPLIELGEARRARDVLLSTADPSGRLSTSRSGHAAAYEILTRAELELGDLAAARSWAQEAQRACHGRDLAGEAAFADRALARVALATGDAGGAAQVALQAAERAQDAGVPVEAGRCRILGARALVQDGDRGRAIDELQRAARDLGRLGADGYREEAERELRRLGKRVGHAADTEVAGDLAELTEREREIALHVARGRTNREIAAATYLSERTVERHLSNIFRKLGVSARAAVASRVAAAERER